jgi:hypothetical protein
MSIIKAQKNSVPQHATIDKKEPKSNKFQGKENSKTGNQPGQTDKVGQAHGATFAKHAKLTGGEKAGKAEDVKAEGKNCASANKDDRNMATDAQSTGKNDKSGNCCK